MKVFWNLSVIIRKKDKNRAHKKSLGARLNEEETGR